METKILSFEQLPLAVSEMLALLQKIETLIGTPPQEPAPADPEPYVYGIKGLAEFLQVSTPTAQKIKNSGRVPYSQAERTIIFRKSEVLESLSHKNKRR